MRRFLFDGFRPGDDRVRLDQVGRAVRLAADFAGIAVLVLAVAVRAFALDETIRQEHRLDRIVELLDRPRFGVAARNERVPDAIGEIAVRCAVGGRVVIRSRRRSREGRAACSSEHARDQCLRRDAFLLRTQHDRGAVRVVRAHVVNLVSRHAHRPHPDVGLDVFEHVPEMDRAVRVGQGVGYEDLARLHPWQVSAALPQSGIMASLDRACPVAWAAFVAFVFIEATARFYSVFPSGGLGWGWGLPQCFSLAACAAVAAV